MFWHDIVGHEATVSVLRRLLSSGHMPHALLLVGQPGIGKGMIALALAAAVLCETNGEPPCGVCPACRHLAQGNHPDLFRFESSKETLKIEQMRELQSAAALAPVLGGRRVVILEDAERLTLPAANSLLKILEEPSDSLLFILTAGSPHSLLSTIISRCRVFALAPAATDVLAVALAAKGYPAKQAAVAARLSGGRMGRALALLEPGGFAARDKALAIVRQTAAITTLSGWSSLLAFEGSEADSLPEIVKQLICLLRDMLLLRSACDKQLLFNTDLADDLAALAADWSETGLRQAVREVMAVARALGGNANSRLTCEAMLLRLEEYHAVS